MKKKVSQLCKLPQVPRGHSRQTLGSEGLKAHLQTSFHSVMMQQSKVMYINRHTGKKLIYSSLYTDVHTAFSTCPVQLEVIHFHILMTYVHRPRLLPYGSESKRKNHAVYTRPPHSAYSCTVRGQFCCLCIHCTYRSLYHHTQHLFSNLALHCFLCVHPPHWGAVTPLLLS